MSAPLAVIREVSAPEFLPATEEDHELGPEEGVRPSISPESQEPLGKPLADFLISYLRQLGWTIDYAWPTFRGHAFEAKRTNNRYDVEIESLEIELAPEMREGLWRLKAAPRTGLLQKLFRRQKVDLDELQLLHMNLDAALLRANVAEQSWHPEI